MSSTRFNPVPKPEPTKKKKKKLGADVGKQINEDIRRRNNINRSFGKNVEKAVAALTGGDRVPMSGAIKNSVFNLEGDVNVKTKDGKKTLFLIETKGTSGITPKGDKTYTLKKSVLDQMKKEGRTANAIPALYLHWRNANYEKDDYVIIPSEDFLKLVEELKNYHQLLSDLNFD